jgi:hypothetical protein
MRIRHGMMVTLMLSVFLLPSNAIGEEKPLWEVGAGLALLQMPDYRGSDENRLYLLPYPYIIYRGDILKVDRERISGRIFKTDKLLLEFSLLVTRRLIVLKIPPAAVCRILTQCWK